MRADDLRYFEPCAETGACAAVVVKADVPIVHTAQVLPIDEHGALLGAGDLRRQFDWGMTKVAAVLGGVGAELNRLVRLNVNVTRDADGDSVRDLLAERFAG